MKLSGLVTHAGTKEPLQCQTLIPEHVYCLPTAMETKSDPASIPSTAGTWTSQKAQNNGPYTAHTLYFGILDHHFGHFAGPGTSIIPTSTVHR